MKILIIANYAKEHINKFHLPIIERLRLLGWHVDVACCKDAEIPFCNNVYDMPFKRNPFRLGTLVGIIKLKKIIKDGEYDVIHCHTYTGKISGIIAAKKFRDNKLKVFYTSHGFQYYKGASKLHWAISFPIDKYLSKYVDVLMLINDEDYQTVIDKKFKSRVILKQYGAGINEYRFKALDLIDSKKSNIRFEFGISDDANVLIYVAELTKNKNQVKLIDMMELLLEEMPNTYLLLVGPDHSSGEIKRYAQSKAQCNIILTGWRSDIQELLLASDIAVASSIREGLGINVAEAMFNELPVVAFDNRGHREMINDGVSGYLVELNDIESMAQRIKLLLNDNRLYKEIAQNAKMSTKNFMQQKITNQILDIYISTLRGN